MRPQAPVAGCGHRVAVPPQGLSPTPQAFPRHHTLNPPPFPPCSQGPVLGALPWIRARRPTPGLTLPHAGAPGPPSSP